MFSKANLAQCGCRWFCLFDFFFFYLFFIWVLRPVKIISLILSQSKGGVKMGDPREKPPDHPQAELGLSDVTWTRLEHSAVRRRAI